MRILLLSIAALCCISLFRAAAFSVSGCSMWYSSYILAFSSLMLLFVGIQLRTALDAQLKLGRAKYSWVWEPVMWAGKE